MLSSLIANSFANTKLTNPIYTQAFKPSANPDGTYDLSFSVTVLGDSYAYSGEHNGVNASDRADVSFKVELFNCTFDTVSNNWAWSDCSGTFEVTGAAFEPCFIIYRGDVELNECTEADCYSGGLSESEHKRLGVEVANSITNATPHDILMQTFSKMVAEVEPLTNA